MKILISILIISVIGSAFVLTFFGDREYETEIKYVATYGSSKDLLGADITSDFPTTHSSHAEDDTIEEEDINALEDVIGITKDPNATSHDYMIRHRPTHAYASSTFPTYTYATSTYLQLSLYFATTTHELISTLPSSDYIPWTSATTTYVHAADWTTIDNYPSACSNQFVRGLADTLTCATVDISSDTNLSAGTNISLSADTLNVDDAFLLNADTDSGIELSLTYGISAATGTFSGGIIGSASSTIANLTIRSSTTTNATTSELHVIDRLTVAGVSTFTGAITGSGGFVGDLTGNADTATDLREGTTTTLDWWGSQRAGDHLSWASDFDVDDDFLLNTDDTGSRYTFDDLVLNYGLTAATGTYSGLITATGGFISQASSTVETLEAMGGFTGALTGNADTATALAADPTDCSSNEFANAIAASGNLTCAAISDADVPDTITITDNITWAGASTTYIGKASTTLEMITTISVTNATTTYFSIKDLTSCDTIDTDASGNLTCGTDNAAAGVNHWDQSGNYLFATTSALGVILQASSTITADFTAGDSTFLFVDADGNVGVSTSTPSMKFSVAGDTYITGDYNTGKGEVADFREKCFTMASSTWQNITTSTEIWVPYHAIEIFQTSCSNGGTSADQGTTTIYFSSSTDIGLDSMTCGYTNSKDTSLSNNTWAADESFNWTLTKTEGNPNFMRACIYYYIEQD